MGTYRVLGTLPLTLARSRRMRYGRTFSMVRTSLRITYAQSGLVPFLTVLALCLLLHLLDHNLMVSESGQLQGYFRSSGRGFLAEGKNRSVLGRSLATLGKKGRVVAPEAPSPTIRPASVDFG